MIIIITVTGNVINRLTFIKILPVENSAMNKQLDQAR